MDLLRHGAGDAQSQTVAPFLNCRGHVATLRLRIGAVKKAINPRTSLAIKGENENGSVPAIGNANVTQSAAPRRVGGIHAAKARSPGPREL
jgi:hypothetical protein